MRKGSLNWVMYVLMIFVLSSCASLTGFEEARTTGENNSELNVSVNVLSFPQQFAEDIDMPGFFPSVDVNYRYGILEKLDVGGRISTNLNLGLFVKGNIIDDIDSGFAFGAGAEFASALGLVSNVQLPLFFSLYPSEKFIINFSPRYVYQFASGELGTGISYIGGNTGFLFGKKHKFGIDLGLYNVGNYSGSNLLFTFGVGGKFKFN